MVSPLTHMEGAAEHRSASVNDHDVDDENGDELARTLGSVRCPVASGGWRYAQGPEADRGSNRDNDEWCVNNTGCLIMR